MYSAKSKRLGDIVNFKRGYDLPSYARRPGEFPVISSGGYSGFHDEYKAEGEGIVTGRYGTLGEMYYVKGKYWPHNTALYATHFFGNYPKYVFYLLKCLGHFKTSDKSTVPGINRNDLHEVNIPFIDREFQKPIADFLFQIDTKIDLNTRINTELESMAKLIYDYWFMQFDFPITAAQAAAMGRPELQGKPYKSSGGKMVWNKELKREVPKGWANCSLSDIGQIVGGSTPSTTKKENFTQGGSGIAWITPKDLSMHKGKRFISHGEQDVTEEGRRSASLNIMPKGTVLLTSRAPVGYMAIARGPVTTNQDFKSLIPLKGISTEYVFMTVELYLPAIIKKATGSTFAEISMATLKTIEIASPPNELIEKFTSAVRPLFEKQDVLEKENQELATLRDWLLPMLMNGQVKVGDVGYGEVGGVRMAAEPRETYGKSRGG